MTRLAEEVGELAQQVNHHESQGMKTEKHGQPSKEKLAKEVQDVIRCALQVSRHYGLEEIIESQINERVSQIQ
jgi:NTP pyrophosphatase (non-canonical NTP hydrolase)